MRNQETHAIFFLIVVIIQATDLGRTEVLHYRSLLADSFLVASFLAYTRIQGSQKVPSAWSTFLIGERSKEV